MLGHQLDTIPIGMALVLGVLGDLIQVEQLEPIEIEQIAVAVPPQAVTLTSLPASCPPRRCVQKTRGAPIKLGNELTAKHPGA